MCSSILQVHDPSKLKFYTELDGRVFLHPSSINFKTRSYASPWLVYLEKRQTSKTFLFDSSMVTPYALLLFGGEITVDHQTGLVAVDGDIQFSAPARIAVLVKGLRQELDRLLSEKVDDPNLDMSRHQVIEAILKLLNTNGL